jgi:hypothetical protein
MKYLTFAAVFVGVTGALIGLRGLAWHPAGAQTGRSPHEMDGAAVRVSEKPGTEAAALDVAFANGDDVKDGGGEKLMARLAADCASHLYEKAKKHPDNVRLLEQAAAHYRACLSHEPTVEDAGALFADARKALEQIEKLLARAKTREADKRPAVTPAPKGAEKPAETKPADRPNVAVKKEEKSAPAPAPAPAPIPKAKEKEEALEFGPDGTLFRRQKGGD